MDKGNVSNQPILKLLIRLWQHISRRRRWQFGLLLFLMLLVSFVEMFSIGLVLPFLGVLSAPEHVFEHPVMKPINQMLGFSSPEQLLLPITIALGIIALISGFMRLLLLWSSTRLSYSTGADISIGIYRRMLYQPYSVHCNRNSSEIIDSITFKSNSIINGITVPVLTLISSFFILTTIFITLFVINPVVALSAFCGFGFIYLCIISFTRRQLLKNSQCIARESPRVIKSLQEGLGGIRDVLLDGSQAIYCRTFQDADSVLRRANGSNAFIGNSPRYILEALGILIIAILAYSLSKQPGGIASAIPVLGTLVFGAQRLLPILQQSYSALAQIQAGQAPLQDTLNLLDQKLPVDTDNFNTHALSFKSSINLKQVSFRYSMHAPFVLKQINLTITKGSKIGFIGTTGSGKSTMIDIIMGLLQPTEGTLEIDDQIVTNTNNRGWQNHISHVPQSIFLIDSSIEENIAFGIPKDLIDFNRVRQAAMQAQIANSIESWPQKYQTLVGERGVRLSGGQRQRIGIARALYKQADVIIFDEATSALDSETELSVMQAISDLNKDLTILIIAHRISTLKDCTEIVEIRDGSIVRISKYCDFVN